MPFDRGVTLVFPKALGERGEEPVSRPRVVAPALLSCPKAPAYVSPAVLLISWTLPVLVNLKSSG